jgi:hypothetical protein
MNTEPTNSDGNGEPPEDHGVTDGLPAGETVSPQATTTGGTTVAPDTRAILFAAGGNTV